MRDTKSGRASHRRHLAIGFAALVAALTLTATPAFAFDRDRQAGPPAGSASFSEVPRSAGSEGPTREPQIVGGETTTIEQWPWQVSLNVAPSSGGNAYDRHICGGSLITDTIVLTAAHCIYGNNGFDNPSNYTVASGRTTLSSNAGRETPVSDFHIFRSGNGSPRYNPQSLDWDVALLRLAAPVPEQPIKIAGADERDLWAGGRQAFVTGWGATDRAGNGPQSNQLRAVSVPMISDSACNGGFQGLNFNVMVCAGAEGRDSCVGDSGGPLVVPLAAGGYRLIGDVSFGSQNCGEPPSVYGRVAGDAMREEIRSAALGLTGVDVVGSGGSPGAGNPPPTDPAPPTEPAPPATPPAGPGSLTRDGAVEKAFRVSLRACRGDRTCRRYGADRCRARRNGFKCRIINQGKDRIGRYTCTRKLRVVQRGDGSIKSKLRGRWRCRDGWR